MKVILNGRIVEAVVEREPGAGVRLVIGGIRLRAAAAAAQTIRLRQATAEEWELLRRAGFHAMWQRRAGDVAANSSAQSKPREEEAHGQE